MSRTSFARNSFNNRKKLDSIIEGYMEKLSTHKKWQKRYFVLNEVSLVYYPDNKKVPSKVREVMALDNISKVEMIENESSKGKTYEVQITCGNNFPYPLKTTKRQEADIWLDALLNTLQENKAGRNSQAGEKNQQDLMMQVAMAMNMGLQMGMQNNNDQMAALTNSIHQSHLNNRQDMLGQLQQVVSPVQAIREEPEEEDNGSTLAASMVNDAMDEVDQAINAGSAKTKDAVEKAIRDAQLLAAVDDDDTEEAAAPTPSELAQDAGADLTASFANFYDNVFGDMDGDDDLDDDEEDPFGEQDSAPSKSSSAATEVRQETTVEP